VASVAIALCIVGLGMIAVTKITKPTPTPTPTPWNGYPTVVDGLSCPVVSRCVIAGAEGVDSNGGPTVVMVSTDGGGIWQLGRLPKALGDTALTAVSCATTHACMAIGSSDSVVASNDGGLTWSLPSHFVLQGRRQSPHASQLDCLTASRCLALTVENTLTLTTDGGDTWEPVSIPFVSPSQVALTDLDCASPLECMVVGSADNASTPIVLTTLDGGVTWKPVSLPEGLPSNPGGVSCPNVLHCYVITDNLSPVVISVVLDGDQWSASNEGSLEPDLRPAVDGAGVSSNSIACISAAQCMAVGGGRSSLFSLLPPDVNLTDNSAVTWHRADLGALIPVSVACPSPTLCMALDDNSDSGFVVTNAYSGIFSDATLTSRDGGQTWAVIRPHATPRSSSKRSN
jgi:hypothetical protein